MHVLDFRFKTASMFYPYIQVTASKSVLIRLHTGFLFVAVVIRVQQHTSTHAVSADSCFFRNDA